MKLKKHIIIPAAFLLLGLLVLNGIFISIYCHLFDNFDIAAKNRLLEYPLLTFTITPISFWLSAYLCRTYSPYSSANYLPLAIDQLKKYPNNFQKISSFLNLRLVVIKTISSLISALGGGALGKEGPSVHMTAANFTVFGNYYKKFFNKISLESWIIAGSSAALALVFNAPIAGIVFAGEKLIKIGHRDLKNKLLLSITVIGLTTLFFYKPRPIFLFRNVGFGLKIELELIIITALVCGFLASLLKLVSNYFYFKISGVKSNWWHVIPISIGLTVALINFYSGIYSFGGGIQTVKQTLASETILLSYPEVGGRVLNTILTFACGAAGGLIAPAITIGVGIGSIISTFAIDTDMGIFLLIGMAGFLAVILGEPISAAILAYEVTGQDVTSLPFLIVAAFIAIKTSEGIDWLKTINFGFGENYLKKTQSSRKDDQAQ